MPAQTSLSQVDILDRAKRLQETFIAVTSHKFLSPITVIKWNLEILLADSKIDEVSKDKLKDIQANIQKLDDLTKILLRIYEVATSNPQTVYAEVKFSSVIDQVIQEFNLLINQNDIKIVNNIKQNQVYSLPGGESFIREIIRSVIENAIHYNKVGGMVQLDINSTDSGLELTISDTGIGIPENERELIFNPFYRGSNVLKLSFKGNGLRLYMVKLGMGIIGGSIGFDSEINKGSKFRLFFPSQPH